MTFGTLWMITLMKARSTIQLFERTLGLVNNAPINLFYDITPIGRIQSMFGNEMSNVVGALYQMFAQFLMVTLNIFQILLMIVAVVPQILPVVFVMFHKLYHLFHYMRPAVQESDRIGKANDGPIGALTKATFNGNQVIRAFKKESYF